MMIHSMDSLTLVKRDKQLQFLSSSESHEGTTSSLSQSAVFGEEESQPSPLPQFQTTIEIHLSKLIL